MGKKNRNPKATDEDLVAAYEGVMKCKPVMPPQKFNEIADLVYSKGHLIRSWRCAAFLATKGGDFYKEISTDADKAKALAAAVEPLRATAKRLRGMAEVMDCVATRTVIAGCNHEGFNAWMEASDV